MSNQKIDTGPEAQPTEAQTPTGDAAAASSAANIPVKKESNSTEQASQSTLAAAPAEAVEAASAASVSTAPKPSPSAAPADEVKTEPAEAPESGEAAPAPAAGPEQGAPGAETTAGAGGDQAPTDQPPPDEEPVPQLVKVVHSARSVFRQRDVKEYDPFTAHLERRITKLFEALDTEQTGRVDVHELGTLIRSVGCCPSETELQEMVTQLEEEGQPGFIRLQTVMPYIIQCVEDRKYPSASTEQLLQAFQVLAEDCAAQEEARAGPKREKKEEEKDTLPQDKLVHILTEEGEHFSQEEVEEMLSAVPSSETGRVRYAEFVKQLVVPELW